MPVIVFEAWGSRHSSPLQVLAYAVAGSNAPQGPADWRLGGVGPGVSSLVNDTFPGRQIALAAAGGRPVMAVINWPSKAVTEWYGETVWFGAAPQAWRDAASGWTMQEFNAQGRMQDYAGVTASSLDGMTVLLWLARPPSELLLCAAATRKAQPGAADWTLSQFYDPACAGRRLVSSSSLSSAAAQDTLICAYGILENSGQPESIRVAHCRIAQGQLGEWSSVRVVHGAFTALGVCVAQGVVYVFYGGRGGLRVACCAIDDLDRAHAWRYSLVHAGEVLTYLRAAAAELNGQPALLFNGEQALLFNGEQAGNTAVLCAVLDAPQPRGPASWRITRVMHGAYQGPNLAQIGGQAAACFLGGEWSDPAIVYATSPGGPPREDADWRVTTVYGNPQALAMEAQPYFSTESNGINPRWYALAAVVALLALGLGLAIARYRRRLKQA